jgi:hypothetical protein
MEATDKTYLVRCKPPGLIIHTVTAARAEIHGEHLVLLDSTGKPAARSCWRLSRAVPSCQMAGSLAALRRIYQLLIPYGLLE